MKPNAVESMSPNPPSNSLTVKYKINKSNSSYLMIISYYGDSATNNHILDTNSQQTQIDVSAYPTRTYTIALVCDSEIFDAKTLIKQ